MSFTPDDQRISLQKFNEALDDVRNAMINRIRDRERWNREHIKDLAEWVKKLTDLQVELESELTGLKE